jgi:cytochrome P450
MDHHVAGGCWIQDSKSRFDCIGAHMARIEIRALLKALLPRLESVELAAPPRRTASTMVSGIASLPIRCAWRD